MKFRTVTTGAIAGLLISLADLYPAISLLLPLLLPGFTRPIQGELISELIHGTLLMLSVLIGVPIMFAFGAIAARRAGSRTPLEGLKAGSLAGLVVGVVFYIAIVSPLTALAAHGHVSHHRPSPANPFPDTESLEVYVDVAINGGDNWFVTTLVSFILLGAVSGIIYGKYHRRSREKEPETLSGLIEGGYHPKQFFARDDSSLRVGLLVGMALGGLYALILLSNFYVAFINEIPSLSDAIRMMVPTGGFVSGPVARSLPILSPLGFLGILLFGAVIIVFLKDPPSRFMSRIKAVVLASVTIFIALLLVLSRIVYFHLGLGPFYVYQYLARSQDTLFWDFWSESSRRFLMVVLNNYDALGEGVIISIFLFPWVLIILVFPFMALIGLGQGVFFAVTIPSFRPSPVDRAAMIQQKLRRKPEKFLPTIYQLFSQYDRAYSVLAHLVTRTHETLPDISAYTLALYTIGSGEEPMEKQNEAVKTVHQFLLAHPEWQWAPDMGVVYGALDEILSAKTVYHILAIRPLPEQQTSSLPPTIVKSIDYISKVISEFHKVDKVEDLQSKMIFLENSMEAIDKAERFVTHKMVGEPANCASTLPEQPLLNNALNHWQRLVLQAVKHLKGRADLSCEMLSRQFALSTEVPFICQVANRGLNVAQQVRLQVLPSEDYRLTEPSMEMIEILPPGEEKVLTVPLAPQENVRRLRVAWEVTYDDAVDANRQLSFADVIEFSLPDRPFERIFPIPYVTGTPLKTDDVFVGREDVFAFIRENLLGIHQNNVIILHGQRRTGKTSVLYRLSRAMSETHYGVLIDMQGKPARGEADFLYSIADDIIFALEDHDIFIDMPPRSAFEEAPEFYFRSRFLRSLIPHLEERNLLLMFDEFEELQRRVEDGRLQPEIFQFLRNLMQHESHVDFIFSGTHKLEELGAEYWSILFNIAVYKPITFLGPKEVQRLIDEPLAGHPLEYDQLAVERIIDVTAGHPYFTQLVLHEMIVYYNEYQRAYLTVTDVDKVLERIVERGEAHFKYIWSESSAEDQQLLKGMAEMLVGAEVVNVNDLRQYLQQRGCESADDWQEGLASLEGRDILTRSSAKSTLYRFKVDLIRVWIDRTRPAL